jgi:hypothetical protein
MTRARAAAAVIAGVLALAGCGGNSDAADAQGDATAAAAPTTEAGPPFDDLCDEWCDLLEPYDTKCEFPDADATTCRRELALGYDATTAIADALATAERESMGDVDNVLDAIDKVREAYDTYQDDSNCMTLELTALSSLPMTGVQQANLMTCQLKANTAALTLSSVGAVLRNATE